MTKQPVRFPFNSAVQQGALLLSRNFFFFFYSGPDKRLQSSPFYTIPLNLSIPLPLALQHSDLFSHPSTFCLICSLFLSRTLHRLLSRTQTARTGLNCLIETRYTRIESLVRHGKTILDASRDSTFVSSKHPDYLESRRNTVIRFERINSNSMKYLFDVVGIENR